MAGIDKRIRDVLADAPPLVVGPRELVMDVVNTMTKRGAPAALVATVDGLVGIFTERDYLVRVVAAGRAASRTMVGAVMTAEPDTLCLDDAVGFAINRMAIRGYRNVPIIDDAGQPIALIGVGDVVDHLTEIFADEAGAGEDGVYDDWLDIGGG